mmetsp:Transcript_25346/g.42114  ORF Transcript_25346/g.42114 Transcript_25346/m.42114 type:complete len:152 (+) Transcript_25346:481-936(+)
MSRWHHQSKSSKGAAPPLHNIEPYLVEVCKQKARMGQPMGMTEGLAMANSMIQGTEHQDALKNEHVQNNLAERYKVARTLREHTEQSKQRMTAGFLFKYGHVVLDSEVLDLVEAKEQRVVSSRAVKRATLITEYGARKEAALAVMALQKPD